MNRAFKKVHRLLLKESHRPFLKRYLRRDEIQIKIGVCDTSLSDALGMFSVCSFLFFSLPTSTNFPLFPCFPL